MYIHTYMQRMHSGPSWIKKSAESVYIWFQMGLKWFYQDYFSIMSIIGLNDQCFSLEHCACLLLPKAMGRSWHVAQICRIKDFLAAFFRWLVYEINILMSEIQHQIADFYACTKRLLKNGFKFGSILRIFSHFSLEPPQNDQ